MGLPGRLGQLELDADILIILEPYRLISLIFYSRFAYKLAQVRRAVAEAAIYLRDAFSHRYPKPILYRTVL